MCSSKGSAKLNDEFRFAGTNTLEFVDDLLDGVGVGTISHVQRNVDGKVWFFVERMGRVIGPVVSTGNRIKTLRDVLTDEKPQ